MYIIHGLKASLGIFDTLEKENINTILKIHNFKILLYTIDEK